LFALTLLPICYVRLLSGAIVAERFLFVPSAAIALAVALIPGARAAWAADAGAGTGTGGTTAGGQRAPKRGPRAARPADAGLGILVVGGVAAIWLAILLGPRVSIWKNEGVLYNSMLRDAPESPHVHAIAGNYFYKTRDLERAAYHFRRAIALAPD